MPLRRLPTVAMAIAAASLLVATTQDPVAARVPHVAAPLRADAPVLSPEEEMRTFRLPDGYRVELVASEPMVEEPVLIDWDPNGRLWVVEMLGYMQDLPASAEREPIGRISVLEDENGDGRMDKKTVFLDGLVLPRALKVLDRGVLVGEPPNLWFARDTNGDLRADGKELVTDKFGRRDANVEHNANTLLWALDNRIHTSETDVYFRYEKGAFATHKTLARGQWGASQDDAGRIYRNTNESVLHVDVVPTPYYARNPSLLRTRGSYESLRGDKNEVMTVWPAHPTRGVNRGYQTGVLREDGTLAAYTSVSAPTVYRGDRLPRDVYGNVFVVEPAGNLVSRIIIADDGTRLRARKAYEGSEFLASGDERFRPVYLSNAPDGNLYLVDMYRGIIQHKAYITEYLRDQILSRRLDVPPRHGRIYRIVYAGADAGRRGAMPSIDNAPASKLVALLAHPNGWWRDTAQRLLVERSDTSAVPALTKLASDKVTPATRLHALWTLDGLDALQPQTILLALDDPSRDVRVSAVRLAERHLSEPGSPVLGAVLKHVHDPDWEVRAQIAASLGALPPGSRDKYALAVLQDFGTDPVMVDATLSGLEGREPAVLAALLQSTAETAQSSAAITMLAGTIVKSGREALVHDVFQRVTDIRPLWQRSALMRGVEAALLGAAMPGGGGRRGANAAPDTEPGGRAGPGGAPAFPRAPSTRPAAVTALKLSREPALLALVARNDSDLSARATAVLARIDWPGKLRTAPAAAPLTAAEQQRFDDGKKIYQTLCAACHQPDGRGQERVAPSLVGSELALGPAGIPTRIVLNGKEGPVGLMPPLGSVLSDDQIAAALTYIRREWGHTAAPVDPATVQNVRAQFAARARPWTVDELSDLLDNGRGAKQRH
ncbi:MAG TPA: c-type cytochrome [Vicinamibacterales bacterium]|nr:c-type cytochrome [Vicinamibacterales bacterium]